MVYARSRRSLVLVMLALLASGLTTAALAAIAAARASNLRLGLLLVLPAVLLVAFAGRAGLRLRGWPRSRLGIFADGILVAHRGVELRASWDRMELVTLAEPNEWTAANWPEVRLTDRLTIRVKGGRPFSLRPRQFGLDPVFLRDLVIRLRDEPPLRARLPEFDSELDLERARLESGERMRPTI